MDAQGLLEPVREASPEIGPGKFVAALSLLFPVLGLKPVPPSGYFLPKVEHPVVSISLNSDLEPLPVLVQDQVKLRVLHNDLGKSGEKATSRTFIVIFRLHLLNSQSLHPALRRLSQLLRCGKNGISPKADKCAFL